MTTLGGYVLEQKLGQGSMGVIWRARHPRFPGHAFALKVMAWKGDEALRTRFRQELKALERVTAHPNVVRVLGGGSEGETLYFVMELVDGDALHRLVKREGPIEARRAATLLRDAAGALAHVHACDVIHRDLKPENILLGKDGRIRLADFGLAHVGGVEGLTRDGAMIGTPAFAAPEQVKGGGLRDRRIDVYGLGAVLWFLIHGRPPFQGADVHDLIRKVRHEPPERGAAPVAPELEAIARKAMAKRADARYQTAEELRADLDRFLAGERPDAATPARRRPWLALALAVVILGAGAVGLVLARTGDRREASRPAELVGDERLHALLRGKLEPGPTDATLLEAAFGSRDATTRDRALGVALEHSGVFAVAPETSLGAIVAFASGRQALRGRARQALAASSTGADLARAIAAADELVAAHSEVILEDARANETRAGTIAVERFVHALTRIPTPIRARTIDAILAPVWAAGDRTRSDAWEATLDALAAKLAVDEVPPDRLAVRLLGRWGARGEPLAHGERSELERLLPLLRARNPGLASRVCYRLAMLTDKDDERTFLDAVHRLEEGESLAAAIDIRERFEGEYEAHWAARRLSYWPRALSRATWVEISRTELGACLAAANFLNRHAPVPDELLERVRGTVYEAEALRQRGDLEQALAVAERLDSSEARAVRALVHKAKGELERARAEASRIDANAQTADATIIELERWNVERALGEPR
ncbi:MAG TPA: protein kinase [Planctomycetota bacterium]|nr:protein kinase [Planctomycetota bacterium]